MHSCVKGSVFVSLCVFVSAPGVFLCVCVCVCLRVSLHMCVCVSAWKRRNLCAWFIDTGPLFLPALLMLFDVWTCKYSNRTVGQVPLVRARARVCV